MQLKMGLVICLFQAIILKCFGIFFSSGNLELSAKYFQDLVLKDQNHPSSLINYAALLLCRHGSVIAGMQLTNGIAILQYICITYIHIFMYVHVNLSV